MSEEIGTATATTVEPKESASKPAAPKKGGSAKPKATPKKGTAAPKTVPKATPKAAPKARGTSGFTADDAKRAQRIAQSMKHMGDGTRVSVLMMLGDGEKHVGAICNALGQSQPAVSHHLALMRHGGVIEPRRVGKNNFYALTEYGRELESVIGTFTR